MQNVCHEYISGKHLLQKLEFWNDRNVSELNHICSLTQQPKLCIFFTKRYLHKGIKPVLLDKN